MIYLIDFDDSFTFNLASLLKEFGQVEILHYSEVKSLYSKITFSDVVCLGPGPGHINEYRETVSDLLRLCAEFGLFTIGVCLGHQLIMSEIYKCEINRCLTPMHGQKVNLKHSKYFCNLSSEKVQRYNSWTVEWNTLCESMYMLDSEGELAYFLDEEKKVLTMQFHPESVGTSCPKAFFLPLTAYLRYSLNDEKSQLSWHLR